MYLTLTSTENFFRKSCSLALGGLLEVKSTGWDLFAKCSMSAASSSFSGLRHSPVPGVSHGAPAVGL